MRVTDIEDPGPVKSIAVSDLDAFQWYHQTDESWREFASRLLRRTSPSMAAKIGTDLHTSLRALSTPSAAGARIDTLPGHHAVKGGFAMPEKPQLKVLPIQGATFEVACEYPVKRREDTLKLVGSIDAMTPDNHIWEFKTTRRATGWVDRYMDSYQWQAYALCRDAMVGESALPIHYVVFFLRYDPNDVQDGAHVDVTDIAELEVVPYQGMRKHVVDAMEEFAEFIDVNLPAYWQRRSKAVRETGLDAHLRDPRRWSL